MVGRDKIDLEPAAFGEFENGLPRAFQRETPTEVAVRSRCILQHTDADRRGLCNSAGGQRHRRRSHKQMAPI